MTGDLWHSIFGVVLLAVGIAVAALAVLAVCRLEAERRPVTRHHRRRK